MIERDKQISDFENLPLQALIEFLQSVKDRPGARIKCDYEPWEDSAHISWMEQETDAEYAIRVSRRKAEEERGKAFRRAKYEELRKEFGDV